MLDWISGAGMFFMLSERMNEHNGDRSTLCDDVWDLERFLGGRLMAYVDPGWDGIGWRVFIMG